MSRIKKITIPTLMAGALLALLAGTQGTREAQADGLTREELVGLYRALMPTQYQPPACVAGQERFTDVPASHLFCAWIEEMARRGITSGCTPTEYCPGNPVTRGQMAVFVVKATETCPTLDPMDEMIRVGGVCIDKYEASIWDAPVGGNLITGSLPCSPNGQDCTNIYARSVAATLPRGNITWFQAQAALANSGKRLPTNAEWQLAVAGTPDPGALPGVEDCNTNSGGPDPTGARSNCVSRWGAFDMVGNLWEWVADWVPASTDCPGWGGFSDDYMCLAGASTTAEGPGALFRGGAFYDLASAGPWAVNGLESPYESFFNAGFRGAR